MEPVRSGCFCAFILFLAVRLRGADSVKVIVGDPIKIPVSCEPEVSGRLLRDLGDDGTREVATCQRGEWKVSREEDRGRIEIDSSNTNIVFTRSLFTDGGIYELTSTSGTRHVQLEVVFASEKSVTLGDKVTLPCYVKTIRGTNLPGRWEKNGKPVCVKNFDSKSCSGTPGDRLTVSTDWTNTGDLTLTIEGAQLEDGGDYFCYIQDQLGKQSGTPAAVRLSVTEKKTHQMISSTAAPTDPTQSCAEHPWQMSTLVLTVILVLVALVALCLWRLGKISCDSGKLYEVVQRSCHVSTSTEATTSV